MHPLDVLLTLILLGAAAAGLIWLARRNTASHLMRTISSAESSAGSSAGPPATPPPPPPPQPNSDRDTDDDAIEDGRAVVPTPITLVWMHANRPPERWRIEIDMVSRDTLAFAGMAKRLDVIQIVTARRLFHTMLLPHERLLAAHDASDTQIENIRAFLAALPEA